MCCVWGSSEVNLTVAWQPHFFVPEGEELDQCSRACVENLQVQGCDNVMLAPRLFFIAFSEDSIVTF